MIAEGVTTAWVVVDGSIGFRGSLNFELQINVLCSCQYPHHPYAARENRGETYDPLPFSLFAVMLPP